METGPARSLRNRDGGSEDPGVGWGAGANIRQRATRMLRVAVSVVDRRQLRSIKFYSSFRVSHFTSTAFSGPRPLDTKAVSMQTAGAPAECFGLRNDRGACELRPEAKIYKSER